MASPSANQRSKLHDKAKHTAVLIQIIMEELQVIEEESVNDLPFLIDEQKLDSNTDKTDINPDILETLNQDINHMEEVVIGAEYGTTFPTQIGTSVCHALIDTGATRSCISEAYYQSLPLTKIQFIQNISVRSATGSNLSPLGLINCSFELGKVKFSSDFIVLKPH